MITLPGAWKVTTGNRSVNVAVIDTGIYLQHDDLVGQLIGGYDFISDVQSAGDGDGIDNDPNDVGDGGAYGTSSYHGTHVAGTIGANTNNGVGVAGISWLSSIMPIRALGIGGGSDYDIAQGILYAAGLPNDSLTVPPQRADIINMSIGGAGFSQVLADAVTDARAAGVIIVAAAGNEANSANSYPAALTGVISVSAVDAAKNLAPYSSYGTTIDIAAPGGDTSADLGGDGQADGVLSTLATDAGESLVGYYQGTSMAAPHVAGVISLMKAVNPAITPANIDSYLAAGNLTDDIGTAGRDDLYGFGLIDARKAVEFAAGPGNNTGAAELNVYPQSLNFGVTLTSFSLDIDKTTESALVVTSITSSEPTWLSVTPTVSGDGLGSYQVIVDRSGLADDIYTGEITVVSSNGSKTLNVLMQVAANSVSGKVATSYVLLINPDTDKVVDQYVANNPSGSINYSFSQAPEGNYQIIVGTDMDGDGYICDRGEACGGYPTLNSLEKINITSDISGLNFTITFADTSLVLLDAQGNISNQSVFTPSFMVSGKGLKLLGIDTNEASDTATFKRLD